MKCLRHGGDGSAAAVTLSPQPITHARVHLFVVPAHANDCHVTGKGKERKGEVFI